MWRGDHFPFNQAVLSRTLVNPFYLEIYFFFSEGTSKMRPMEFCHKIQGKYPFMVNLVFQSLLKGEGPAGGHHYGSRGVAFALRGLSSSCSWHQFVLSALLFPPPCATVSNVFSLEGWGPRVSHKRPGWPCEEHRAPCSQQPPPSWDRGAIT